MIGTAIVGAVFLDIKGYPFGPYSPTGTNIGTVEFADGGVARITLRLDALTREERQIIADGCLINHYKNHREEETC